jgi:hypothetical protein
MNLTSSVISFSLLAQPDIDKRLPARRRACVEHVSDRFLVEADQDDHDLVVGWEPADEPDGDVGIVWMRDPPQLVPPGLPDSLEGRGLLGRLRGQVGERLQQRDRDGQEPAALLFGMIEPRVELVRPVDDYTTKYNLQLISLQVYICWWKSIKRRDWHGRVGVARVAV